MHAEDAVARRVGEELDEARRLSAPERAAVVGEGKRPALVGHALALQLLLGLADPGDLGRGVDHPGMASSSRGRAGRR